MLVLGRKARESITIDLPTGETILLMIVSIRGENVKIGIDAPKDCKVLRTELLCSAAGGAEDEKDGSPPATA